MIYYEWENEGQIFFRFRLSLRENCLSNQRKIDAVYCSRLITEIDRMKTSKRKRFWVEIQKDLMNVTEAKLLDE